MNAYLTNICDVVFVFTTLEVSRIVRWTMVDSQVDVSYRKADFETADENSYDRLDGSLWRSYR